VNVDKIIQRGKDAGVKHFLIISPPPVCEACKKDKPVSGSNGMMGEGQHWRSAAKEGSCNRGSCSDGSSSGDGSGT
jgi:hypothetical protein